MAEPFLSLDAGERAAVAVGRAHLDRQTVGPGAQQVGDLDLVDRLAPPEAAARDLMAVQMHRVLAVGGHEQASCRLRRLVQLEVAQQHVGRRLSGLRGRRLGPDPLRRAGRQRGVATPRQQARRDRG